MSQQVKSIVIAGNGTNCERETAHAARLAGADQVDVRGVDSGSAIPNLIINGDDGDDIGQHTDELARDVGDAGQQQFVLKRLSIAEESRGAQRAERHPVAKDHGCQ